MGKTISAKKLLEKKFKSWEFTGEWLASMGKPEKNFKMLIWGKSGMGKTTFALQLCKYLSGFGKVYYNSVEQGEGKSLQDCLLRVGVEDIDDNMLMFGDRDNYEDMMLKVSKNRCLFVVIDSLQYMGMTTQQYKDMVRAFKNKSVIVISWEGSDGEPKGQAGKDIRYMSCVKVHVKRGKAHIMSRFGGNKEPFEIFGGG